MSKLIDLTGQRFGKLIVIEKAFKDKRGQWSWLCKCDCGNIKSVLGANLRRDNTKSCGCINLRIDITGKRYGMLVALSLAYVKNQSCVWLCKCDCGNETTARVGTLTMGRKLSCGCKEGNITHGATHTTLYKKYQSMLKRCSNKKDKDYGGRGITVCDEWKEDFLAFYNWAHSNGYEKNLTIERIDVNGNYCPENCTWISSEKQANNKTNSRYFTYKGETKNTKQWAADLGFCEKTMRERLRKWTIEEALTTPKYKRRKNSGNL